jgi:hypothetical protein
MVGRALEEAAGHEGAGAGGAGQRRLDGVGWGHGGFPRPELLDRAARGPTNAPAGGTLVLVPGCSCFR